MSGRPSRVYPICGGRPAGVKHLSGREPGRREASLRLEPLIFLAGAAVLLDVLVWLTGRWAGGGRGLYLLAAAAPFALLATYVYLAPLPSPYARLDIPGSIVLDASGVVLQRDAASGLRIPVALDQVAPIAVQATLAAEDQRFRVHPGVDPLAMARALVQLPARRSGASTITQQLARRLYLGDDRSPVVVRKAREAVLALQIEARLSKDEILGLYLNDVYYGRGAYGIEAAARAYFGVSARNLDLAQASFLAGLTQSPGSYGDDPATAKARQRYVLGRLVDRGQITGPQSAAALERPLLFTEPDAAIAPHFVAYALDELRRLRPDLADRPGLIIETTLDAGLQQETEAIVRFQLDALKDRDVSNAAVVALDPRTGAVLAMVGSAGFADEAIAGQINMALQPRQPGSALKPFLYAAAMERGFTAATPLLDLPVTFQTRTGPYTPLNYDRRFHGVVPLRVALASSYNVPAVRTLDAIGVEALLEMAHRFGLATLTDAEAFGLALTLGGGEVRLLDLTAAYGALAGGGQLMPPYAVSRVRDASGRVLFERQAPTARRVLAPEIAYVLSDILADADARLPGFGPNASLTLPVNAAVKTGTTTGFRDNWTLGATPERAVGVWVGNADNRPMANVSGVEAPGRSGTRPWSWPSRASPRPGRRRQPASSGRLSARRPASAPAPPARRPSESGSSPARSRVLSLSKGAPPPSPASRWTSGPTPRPRSASSSRRRAVSSTSRPSWRRRSSSSAPPSRPKRRASTSGSMASQSASRPWSGRRWSGG